MPYSVVPLKHFLVRPAIPIQLNRLLELAYNLVWSWDHSLRAVFRRLDPVVWKESNHNPVKMLGMLHQSTLDRAASDARYLALYRRACNAFDEYVWAKQPQSGGLAVAYFSMEYGLLDCMPIYGGGLGVLSGDHLKAASDSRLPLVGVGLLYQKGYLQQSLNPDGWQQERMPINDFYTLPVRPCVNEQGDEVLVSVALPAGKVWIKVWYIDVGRVKLYLLDTNVQQNSSAECREITDQLYGGDYNKRIRQEIVLGIGGLRALEALGYQPSVFHMNEGHSAFLAIERIRVLMAENQLTFEQALEATRLSNVFTTHTSVPAGIYLFDQAVMLEYFGKYAEQGGFPFEKLLRLGLKIQNDGSERFSMAVLALKTSAFRNAVSVLHRHVSQEMFQELWPKLPAAEVPIVPITNGVHLPTWLNGDLATLYDQYLQPDWRERVADPAAWKLVYEIPSQELWEVHRKRKRRMVAFLRERAVSAATQRKAPPSEIRRMSEVLDPESLTIGFARRFATYKRATLLFRDAARLKKILNNPAMPVQIVVAGKAHPKDHPGKSLIREIVTLSRDPEFSRRLVFIEDYGIQVAREMVQSVDIWLNNPRRGEEACGTSGMKASMNGVLNLSVLDGWFDEAFEESGGWAIGGREPYSEEQDEIHASSIYSILENEIIPLYYEHRDQGAPLEWIKRMKTCIANISPRFNSGRMVANYRHALYEPAFQQWQRASEYDFAAARQKTVWDQRIQETWSQVRFIEAKADIGPSVINGESIALRAVVHLGGLKPSEVRVEAVIGPVGPTGQLDNAETVSLAAIGQTGEDYQFESEYTVRYTGRLGFSMRVSPNHFENPITRPCNSPLKWVAE
jgi:starch phosphorylase